MEERAECMYAMSHVCALSLRKFSCDMLRALESSICVRLKSM